MHSEFCVRASSVTTKPFRVRVGTMRGCSLLPILFLIFMNRVVKKREFCDGIYLRKILHFSTIPKMVSVSSRQVVGCMLCYRKINTTKAETLSLSRQPQQCFLTLAEYHWHSWGNSSTSGALFQWLPTKIRNQISASEKQVQEGARFFYLSLKNGEHGTKEKLFIYCTSQRSFPDLWLLVLDHDWESEISLHLSSRNEILTKK